MSLCAEEHSGWWNEQGKGISVPKLVNIIIHAGQFFIVAKKDGNPIGFIECGYRQNKKQKRWMEIFAYYTTPKFRRSGLAKRLTAQVALKARKENLRIVTIPNPTERVVAMVERMRQMQESTPKEKRAVRARIHAKKRSVIFKIKPKRRIK